ncbi:DUF4133 domain-containing protein [Chitinophaga tropicalis]|uniref:DUF4133 domain-containing protein n=1 Tax=Chitinophaga tropicalis TaxID=2683588 RepID=A0A7K1U014_9BACT|nr:DUF4133 domain-containing protein [Chitinophaga tropicalis]MVT07704.1 DUF4133 domain-containing protein [Chitinophaga tropicalis]
MNTIYEINKGINRPLEFRGLKAQYIVYFVLGLIGLLVLFAVAFIAGVPTLICFAGTGVLGFVLYVNVYRYSNKYGSYGLMKEAAFRQVPAAIRCRTRKVFVDLNRSKKQDNDSGNGTVRGHSDRSAVDPAR